MVSLHVCEEDKMGLYKCRQATSDEDCLFVCVYISEQMYIFRWKQ